MTNQPIYLTALAEQLAALRPGILRWLVARQCAPDLAEEIVQEASLRALTKLYQLRDHSLLKPWFKQIVRNVLKDEYKRQSRLQPLEQFPEPIDLDTDTIPNRCGCILKILSDIPEQYARLLMAVDIDEDAVQDVAKHLGIQPNNASVRLHRARRALRGQLFKVCGTQSSKDCLDCAC